MNIVTWLYLIFGLALANLLLGADGIRAFLSRTQSISSSLDLQNFQQLVRRQMIQALLQIGLLLAGLVMGIYALVSEHVGLLLILALNGTILIVAKVSKRLEERARSLPVPDPVLENRYKAMCHTWLHKAFPDF